MTRKRTSWKPTQSFKRGLPKLCVTYKHIKNKQRANLQVKGEFSFPPYFLLKKNWFKIGISWSEENSKSILRSECYICLHQLLSQWVHKNSPQLGPKLSPGAVPRRPELRHHKNFQSPYLSFCNQSLINGPREVSHFPYSHQISIIEATSN